MCVYVYINKLRTCRPVCFYLKDHKYTWIPQFLWFFDYPPKRFDINRLIVINFRQLVDNRNFYQYHPYSFCRHEHTCFLTVRLQCRHIVIQPWNSNSCEHFMHCDFDSLRTLYVSRWRFVIHGGVDGFSRLIVYMGVSDNNRATTVFRLFQDAVRQWALPSRVR